MATPLFNNEILKLRRRLGDIFTADGTEITSANIESVDGSIFSKSELADAYNDAVRLFIDYVIRMYPKSAWYNYIPGYIILAINVALVNGKLDFSGILPTPYKIIDVRKYNSGTYTPSDLMTEIAPGEYFSIASGLVKTRQPSANNLFWTVLSESSPSGSITNLHILGGANAVDLIYIQRHENISYGGSKDINGISSTGLDTVLLFAEKNARRYRIEEVGGIPESELKNKLEFDLRTKDLEMKGE